MNAMVPATVGDGRGVALSVGSAEGEVAALGELAAVVLVPPQAATAPTASTALSSGRSLFRKAPSP
jgi:hypothetical protein